MEKLKQENAELKRLLRLVTADITQDCQVCANNQKCIDNFRRRKCKFKWRYAAEAEKLLNGGESNDKS